MNPPTLSIPEPHGHQSHFTPGQLLTPLTPIRQVRAHKVEALCGATSEHNAYTCTAPGSLAAASTPIHALQPGEPVTVIRGDTRQALSAAQVLLQGQFTTSHSKPHQGAPTSTQAHKLHMAQQLRRQACLMQQSNRRKWRSQKILKLVHSNVRGLCMTCGVLICMSLRPLSRPAHCQVH